MTKNAAEWNLKGVTLSRQNKYEEAIQAFDQAIRINPEYADAWLNMADALSNLDIQRKGGKKKGSKGTDIAFWVLLFG